ncbi:MAG: pimeloyl-ACP methyl ester esterase BioH, partial [Thiohalobacterales bacterium]|nr:pimeloyl-ACP methyl ester esterase BioH [Thiohalobacterales bacterium]
RVDLPGHGRSPWSGEATLDAMLDAVCPVVPEEATWLGWSLGGLLAMHAAARQPGRVRSLVTVASNPCFVRKPDWPSAMLPQLLEMFATELEQDYRRTLDRFLALQVRGSEQATAVLKSLRLAMARRDMPRPEGLQAGLTILGETDLRAALEAIYCPVLLIAGERDTLVPLAALQATAAALPDARLETVAGAGHAPFVTEPVGFVNRLLDFVLHDVVCS